MMVTEKHEIQLNLKWLPLALEMNDAIAILE